MSIIEVDQFLATWKTVDRLVLSMWADFLRRALKLVAEEVLKNKVLQCLYKIERMWGMPRKNELS